MNVFIEKLLQTKTCFNGNILFHLPMIVKRSKALAEETLNTAKSDV